MSWFRDTYQCRELDGIHGEPLEFEWKKRISVKESLVQFRMSDKSVFQCWSTLAYFKNCKIQPIINLLLKLELRSSPITEWWHFRGSSNCSCPLMCWFRAMCTNQRFGLFHWYSLLKALGNHQDLPHSHSSSLLFNLWTVPSQWNLVSYKILFCNLLRYHVDMNLFFYVDCTLPEYSTH